MSKKGVFIVVTHHRIMARPEMTENDSGPPALKMEIQERCEFVDELKNRYLPSATFILDFLNRKIIKDRSNAGTYEEFEEYVMLRYPQQMNALIAKYRPEELVPKTDVEKIIDKINEEEEDPILIDASTIETGE